jgi:hypothetical protein
MKLNETELRVLLSACIFTKEKGEIVPETDVEPVVFDQNSNRVTLRQLMKATSLPKANPESAKYRGVRREGKRWKCIFYLGAKKTKSGKPKGLYCGIYPTSEEAAEAYNSVLRDYKGLPPAVKWQYYNRINGVVKFKEDKN